ncbi:WD40 repeat-like protein [Obba rivulosa]|uniref:WD40 repeat-like protein n=1 Tax=Obba rivulosa TaxID=1052685 RepID=A0A8E2DQS6_9APHY|nr:WD40 repeat-like protein [Obba rivulosa]
MAERHFEEHALRPISLAALSSRRKVQLLSSSLAHPLDRVNVLGDDDNGHTGCVNALSWARDGELLLSGGDDRTVRLWRLDSTDTSRDYPFVCDAVIHTGHRENIFNAQMLPYSSRIATAAGDKQIRISDVGALPALPKFGGETVYGTRETKVRVLRCHQGRVKRIITEESPDIFLTVGEDGAVRQHDLRVPHDCRAGSCPAPLVQLSHELSTIALSPLTPYQIVVAGESPFGYLFDRRHVGRFIREEWGVPPNPDDVTTCVRRFGRATRGPSERRGHEHITGAKMAQSNGHEVLLSYSSDAVYLYSTRDEAQSPSPSRQSSVIPPTRKSAPGSPKRDVAAREQTSPNPRQLDWDTQMEDDIEHFLSEEGLFASPPRSPRVAREAREDNSEEDEDEEDEDEEAQEAARGDVSCSSVPIVYPRSRFAGAANVETVKDVNFLGPHDEFVVSGSDDGNWFMWKKSTGQLYDILEGDGSIVNVIEGHPHLPLVAVSGIDTTVKLFAPARQDTRSFSRMNSAESIMARNAEASARRIDFTRLLLQYQMVRANPDGQTCTFQ